MKVKTLAILTSLALSALACLGQEGTPAPTAPPPVPPPPVDLSPPAAVPLPPAPNLAQAETPAPAAVVKSDKPEPPPPPPLSPDEVVPLIVIDDVPLVDAIRNLARQAGLNFQFDPRITAVGPDGRATNQGNVSIRFENVTAQEALDAVLDNYNLKLAREPRAKIARVTFKDPKAEEPLISQVVQLKYADPTNIAAVVRATLSDRRGTIVPDPRTAQLIITTTGKEMDAVTNLIVRLDTATRQVLIEAHLLETAINPRTVKGIDWSGTLENQVVTFGNNALPGTPATAESPGTIGGILSDPKLLMSASSGSFFNPATAFLNADGVTAVLSFLNKDTDTEVVATPRAVTLDNQTATLSITRAFPIFNITPGSANSPAGATIQYTNLGVILNVTPRIAADDNISLRVQPEVSNIDAKDEQTLNSTRNTANIYAIRRMETMVMIPSGNTLVMGGLINDTLIKAFVKVPLLGDLPAVGLAFRKESKERKKTNLIIFITPTIIQDGDYHRTTSGREFMANQIPSRDDRPWDAWDSGKPHDWTKPVY